MIMPVLCYTSYIVVAQWHHVRLVLRQHSSAAATPLAIAPCPCWLDKRGRPPEVRLLVGVALDEGIVEFWVGVAVGHVGALLPFDVHIGDLRQGSGEGLLFL